nr:hypothetical protein [Tanacetum cinerariifolium]
MTRKPSISRRNRIHWHYVRDDDLFLTIKVVSRHQATQQDGAILPIELTTAEIRNSKAYQEYHACAMGEAAPKPKASARKKKGDSAYFTTPPTPTPTTTAESALRLSASAKEKQPLRATTPVEQTDLQRTEAEQLKIVLKWSRQETHISQQSGSSTGEGTGSKPGVPDVPSDDSEEELLWKSSDDEEVGIHEEGKESDDDSDEGSDKDSDETVKSGAGKDGDDDDDEDDDDDDEEEELAKDDEEDKETGKGGDEVRKSEGESEEKEGSFDPIPRTPEDKQLKIVLKRSRQETHISQQSGSGTSEGTGSKPGVPDVPSDDSEEELSWKSSDDEEVGSHKEGNESNDDSDDGSDQDSEETVKSGTGKDGDDDNDEDDDDDDEEEETTKDDEEDKETGKSDDEVRKSGDSEKESDGEEEQESRFSEEARIQEEEDAKELYHLQRTEAEQLKIVLKRSRRETHISQQSSFGTGEGTETGKVSDEVRESGGESEEKEETSEEEEGSFDPIPRTPEDSEKESDDEEEQESRLSEEARIQEEEDADELYHDVNINQGRGLQVTQNVEDTHVILTPVSPDDLQESSSMSSFVSSMLNPLSDVGIESIFTMTSSQIVSLEPPTPIMTPSTIALVEAYEADKAILDTYGESTILKRRNQEGPSAGPNRGSKRQKEGGEQASASTPSEKATKGAGGSTKGTQSRQQSASESAHAEEPVQTTSQMEETPLPVYETAKQADARSSFNELLDTPIELSNFIMHRLNVDTLTPDLLAGPTYELMRGSCSSLTELEYHLEEVYKATTDQLDWVNPKGQQYPHNLLQPLPLIPDNRGCRVIPFEHFINNDLEYLRGGALSRKYTTSVTKTKAADYGHI